MTLKVAGSNRAKVACLECRKRKKKCDQQLPSCSSCLKKHKVCEYSVSRRTKPATQNYAKSLLNRIALLEKQLSKYENQVQEDTSDDAPVSQSHFDYHMNLSEHNFRSTVETFPSLSSRSTSPMSAAEKSTGSIAPYNSKVPLILIGTSLTSKWELGFAQNGTLLFEGPTSARYISIFDVNVEPKSNLSCTDNLLDDLHEEVFSWFFNCSIKGFPLVHEPLFRESLLALETSHELGTYASVSLINAIMALYYLNNGKLEAAQQFKSLSLAQINEEILNDPKIVVVQTLLLLCMFSMNEGLEFQSSDAMARAVSLSYHLGLHVSNYKLKYERKISEDEANLRDSVFWCCFMVDKLRSSIVGISPFMNCDDITVKLPFIHQVDPNLESIDLFRDIVTFSDMQAKMFNKCFSAERISSMNECEPESSLSDQILVVSKATVAFEQWRRNMSSSSRYINRKSLESSFLETLQHTYRILLNKPLVTEIERYENVDPKFNQFFDKDSPLGICSISAERIIKLCQTHDISKSVFLYHFLYSLYLASIICLFNISSLDLTIKDYYGTLLNEAILLFDYCKLPAPISDTFLCHLEKFKKRWFV